jgi:hypothetical protein
MSDHYILEGHKAVPADLMTWALWLGVNNDTRVVAKDQVGETKVSTVFLGLDHSYGSGPPLLFETMTFGPGEEECERCTTWEEAEAQHAAMVKKITDAKATGA